MDREVIQKNAEALRSWMEDLNNQRNGWGYPHGIEVDVRDAIDVATRVCASLLGLLDELAKDTYNG